MQELYRHKWKVLVAGIAGMMAEKYGLSDGSIETMLFLLRLLGIF
jgi:hypothetical protein